MEKAGLGLLAALLFVVLLVSAWHPSTNLASVNNIKAPLVAATEVVDSNQTWTGNIVIEALRDLLIKDCTLTVVDGNVTVYGNLTFQNARVVAQPPEQVSYFFVSEYGNLTMIDTNLTTREFRIVSFDSSKAEIYDSTIENIESRNASRIRIVRSSFNHASVYDDSVLDLNEIVGMMTNVNMFKNPQSPRIDICNCSLGSVKEWNEGHSILNIAHSTIGYLETRGSTTLTFDNMTVTGKWMHNGTLVWLRRPFDHIGNFCIEWGETRASGVLEGKGNDVNVEEIHTPPAPIPIGKLAIDNYVNLTVRGEFTAQIRIHYTDEQVAKMKLSTLKLYSYSPETGWQQLENTGVNTTGKYVWGNLRNVAGLDSETENIIAAFGRYSTDVNGDGKIDIKDVFTIAKAFGSTPEHPRWNPDADIDENLIVNIADLFKVAKDFGKDIWIP